jgi:16S rRNA (guanine527-N7)-methyltransferase
MPLAGSSPFGPEEFAALTGVSRETSARLQVYAAMLEDWNTRHNLVSRSTLPDLWRRHMWDSAQLVPMISADVASLVDLGSGAGFPGLVVAELLKQRPGFRAVLYEATAKKCRFLEAVAERLTLPVTIRSARLEDASPERFDLITARACAPLPHLFAYAQTFWGPGTRALLHKGQSVGVELTEARKSWRIDAQRHPSQSDPSGVILELRELHRVAQRSPRNR